MKISSHRVEKTYVIDIESNLSHDWNVNTASKTSADSDALGDSGITTSRMSVSITVSLWGIISKVIQKNPICVSVF